MCVVCVVGNICSCFAITWLNSMKKKNEKVTLLVLSGLIHCHSFTFGLGCEAIFNSRHVLLPAALGFIFSYTFCTVMWTLDAKFTNGPQLESLAQLQV